MGKCIIPCVGQGQPGRVGRFLKFLCKTDVCTWPVSGAICLWMSPVSTLLVDWLKASFFWCINSCSIKLTILTMMLQSCRPLKYFIWKCRRQRRVQCCERVMIKHNTLASFRDGSVGRQVPHVSLKGLACWVDVSSCTLRPMTIHLSRFVLFIKVHLCNPSWSPVPAE